MEKKKTVSKGMFFWICTELLESTTQTGPFLSRSVAEEHKSKCWHGLCGGPNSYVVKTLKAPFYATVFHPDHGGWPNG